MTKTQLLAPYANNPDLRLCMARLLDRREAATTRAQLLATAFLSPKEHAEAEHLLARLPQVRHTFFGGYPAAERRACVFLPDWMEEDDLPADETGPLCALELSLPEVAELSHRDYLGSLMALGLSREKFGDILCFPHSAQVVLLREVLPILHDQWEKVGRYPVRLQDIPLNSLTPPEQKVDIRRETVASLRFDSVVAAGFSLSRGRAAELIAQGRVEKNHRVCEKSDASVAEGDVCSCRGLGKFVLYSVGGPTRKGRLLLELHRFV